MSKALDYLMAARPHAMQSYFGFLKEAGKNLDPRTRAIISIITKVDKQTEAGFRQYLTRALKEGVTANEVLDALLVAFPTLGLSKIIWAMEILLEMDIPEFRPENLVSQQEWHDVAAVDELDEESGNCIHSSDRLLFIYAGEEKIHVYDQSCPHQSTLIPASALDGSVLTCPKHDWSFDLRTGQCIGGGDKPLNRLDSKVQNKRLLVRW